VVEALASVGDVDVFLLADPRHETALNPPDGRVVRGVGVATRSEVRVRPVDRLATLVPGARPAAVRRFDPSAIRAAFGEVPVRPYDLAWFVRIESWLALGDLVNAPAIVDYDDLRDRPVGSRLPDSWPDPRRGTRAPDRVRAVLGRWYRAGDAAAWRRLQRRVATAVAAVVVCSDVDRERLGVVNAVVVPNGVDPPDRPVGRDEVRGRPTICLHGSLAYEPNIDAATILVRDVLPRVRARYRDVEVRLVGECDPRVLRLAQPNDIVVTGSVPDIAVELARADVVAVPLRQGAGTRIKVLEALAQRVPVVATSVAVEGLAVEHGRHLLVADDPDHFADCCVTLLHDRALRRQLADAGERLVRTRYEWSVGQHAVVRLAERVGGASELSTPPQPAGT
jgi:glycosyltransferase involved in cell wall biosynthesis